mmetsp:Transcript_6622/g.18832  ORF Transcript_6622/g.18832 Transcript_6622/m.18832 type:complete len:298 (-) Transcript_6622:201-1094(-)
MPFSVGAPMPEIDYSYEEPESPRVVVSNFFTTEPPSHKGKDYGLDDGDRLQQRQMFLERLYVSLLLQLVTTTAIWGLSMMHPSVFSTVSLGLVRIVVQNLAAVFVGVSTIAAFSSCLGNEVVGQRAFGTFLLASSYVDAAACFAMSMTGDSYSVIIFVGTIIAALTLLLMQPHAAPGRRYSIALSMASAVLSTGLGHAAVVLTIGYHSPQSWTALTTAFLTTACVIIGSQVGMRGWGPNMASWANFVIWLQKAGIVWSSSFLPVSAVLFFACLHYAPDDGGRQRGAGEGVCGVEPKE